MNNNGKQMNKSLNYFSPSKEKLKPLSDNEPNSLRLTSSILAKFSLNSQPGIKSSLVNELLELFIPSFNLSKFNLVILL